MPKGVYVRKPQAPEPAEQVAARFWTNVRKSEGCWEWQGLLNASGYGRFWPGRHMPAHRYSWEIHNGAIPDGRVVCHTCDNRKCVRPHHLFLGSQRDNLIDASKKGRLPNQKKTRCIRGHELTAANVYLRPRGGRTCLPCRRAYNSARKKRLRVS